LGGQDAFELDNGVDPVYGTVWFTEPKWGPLGDRIYVTAWLDDPVNGSYLALRYYDLEENWQALNWPPLILRTDTVISDFGWDGDVTTDYGWFMEVNSGIIDGVEYLAIEDEFSAKTGACKGIFIVNAEDCLVNRNCTTQPEFAGTDASWSKDGKLIHEYDGSSPHGGCALTKTGVWDSSDGSLEPLFDGYQPDAAGGIR
jgi:hypothetical protein